MRRLLALALLPVAVPAMAQPMDHSMHHMPAAPAPAPKPDQSDQPAMPAGHDHGGAGATTPAPQARAAEPAGTDQAPGRAAPPPIVHARSADRYWNPAEMAAAEQEMMAPLAPNYSKLAFDLAEHQFRNGRDGYRWEGEAWLGNLNRFVVRTEGEGTTGAALDRAEVQVLYSKALDPWWNLQAGLRQDIRPRPARTWATLGIEGRARYQFALQAAAFLSDKGQLAGRVEAAFDQRITQRLVFQPRVELELSAQDMREQRIGSGLSSAELGLRLRYEIQREFAPYVGINWTWAAGRTADYARADGNDVAERSVVAGVRFWF